MSSIIANPIVKYGAIASVAVLAGAAFLVSALFVHADTAPIVSAVIHNSTENTISTALVGASVHAIANVATSTAVVPTGTVDFNVFPNTTCASTATTQSGVALVNGNATSSASTMGVSGLSYKVHYNGDANNVVADSPCMPITATSNTSALTTTLSTTTPVLVGSSVHDSAALTNAAANATGTVAYVVYTDANCAVPLQGAGVKTVAAGIIPDSDAVVFNSPGTYHWQAVYSGDQNNSAATSTCASEVLTVNALPVANTVSIGTTLSTTTPVLVGSTIHDSATLSGETGSAGGTVAYTVYTNNACTTGAQSAGVKSVSNGIVSDSNGIVFNSPGTYFWQAVYSGDANNSASTSTCTNEQLTVNAVQTGTGHIIVDKVTNPSGDSTSFSFTTTGSGYSAFSLTDASAPNNQVLNAGTYSVTELGMTGWALASSTCALNGAAVTTYVPGTNLVLNANDTIACTFNNVKNATTTVGNGTISGEVYNDLNKNGTRDAGEAGLPGFTIDLYNSSNFNAGAYDPKFMVTTTDASGNYSFTGLANGTYSVEQVKKTGWNQDTSDYKSVVIAGGAGVGGRDFGDVAKTSNGNGNCDFSLKGNFGNFNNFFLNGHDNGKHNGCNSGHCDNDGDIDINCVGTSTATSTRDHGHGFDFGGIFGKHDDDKGTTTAATSTDDRGSKGSDDGDNDNHGHNQIIAPTVTPIVPVTDNGNGKGNGNHGGSGQNGNNGNGGGRGHGKNN